MKNEKMIVQMTIGELIDVLKAQLPMNQSIGSQKRKTEICIRTGRASQLAGL